MCLASRETSPRPLAIIDELVGGLLQLVFEVIFGAIFEVIGDILARAFPPMRAALTSSSFVSFVASASAGVALGIVSMFVRPQPVAEDELAVSAAILLAPIPMAAGMVLVGRVLEARDRKRSEFERWVPALTFAYAFVLTRVVFRHLGSSAA